MSPPSEADESAGAGVRSRAGAERGTGPNAKSEAGAGMGSFTIGTSSGVSDGVEVPAAPSDAVLAPFSDAGSRSEQPAANVTNPARSAKRNEKRTLLMQHPIRLEDRILAGET